MSPEYTSVPLAVAKAYNAKLLFVTATTVETNEIHSKMTPIGGSALMRINHGTNTYYLGGFGCYVALHVQCNMGSGTPGGSIVTVSEAVSLWSPLYIVMVGIAFGVDERKQQIGDVLIANKIIPYDSKRIGSDSTVYRAPQPPCGPTLLNRFKQRLLNGATRSGKFNLLSGPILSGESLIDNKQALEELTNEFPEAVGGEMEGAGLFASAEQTNTEWIVVKAVCDFANGHKSENKDANQKTAAENAVQTCCEVFGDITAFPRLAVIDTTQFSRNDVLFDFYQPVVERFYLARAIDDKVSESIGSNHVWIYGVSGTGKTAMARRLIKNCTSQYTIIDLSACVNQSVGFIFAEIAKCLGVVNPTQNASEIHNAVVAELVRKGEHLILIDELPLSSADEFNLFRDSLCAILVSLRNISADAKIRFVVISINDPVPGLKSFHVQIAERLAFIEAKVWPTLEIELLFDLVLPFLAHPLTLQEKGLFTSCAANSPRVLKSKLRGYQSMKDSKTGFILTRESIQAL